VEPLAINAAALRPLAPGGSPTAVPMPAFMPSGQGRATNLAGGQAGPCWPAPGQRAPLARGVYVPGSNPQRYAGLRWFVCELQLLRRTCAEERASSSDAQFHGIRWIGRQGLQGRMASLELDRQGHSSRASQSFSAMFRPHVGAGVQTAAGRGPAPHKKLLGGTWSPHLVQDAGHR